MTDYKDITSCLCCGNSGLDVYFSLGSQPLANNYHTDHSQPAFPLEVAVCPKCFHNQLTISVNPHLMFDHYIYVSGTSQTLRAYFEGFAHRILADWKKKGKSGAPKVAVLSWDNAYGREMLRGGKEYAEMKGVQILPSELFPPGSLKHDVYLTRLDRAGANYIYVGGVDPTQTNVMRDATALGLTKKIQFISDYWGPSSLGVGLHPEALEGMVVISFFLRGAESLEHPLLKELWTNVRKKSMDKFNEGYGIGVGAGMNLVGAVKDVVKRVGKNKVTRAEVHKSYERITGMDRQGISGPCTYSPTARRGADVVKFYRVTQGKIVSITGWVKTPDAVSLHKW